MIDISRYFDSAAARPFRGELLGLSTEVLQRQWGNPSGLHAVSRESKAVLESARHDLAKAIAVPSQEVYFTEGVSEANTIVIRGVLDRFPGSNIIVSAAEHSSVMGIIDHPVYKSRVRVCGVDRSGTVDIAELERLIDKDTALISVVAVASETGVRQPLKDIGALILRHKKRGGDMPLYFHSDASQAFGFYDLAPHRIGLDMMTVNIAKIGGHKRSAVLYMSKRVALAPLIIGGDQERGVRAGTESVEKAVTAAKAVELAVASRKRDGSHVGALRRSFEKQLKRTFAEHADFEIVSSSAERAPHISGMLIPDADAERFVMKMDEKGFSIATGSACASYLDSFSSYLLAMKMGQADILRFVRFSFLPGHTQQDIEMLLASVGESWGEVRGL